MTYPSFKAITGRDPIQGKDFNPDGDFCQDDYEYYQGIGRYSDNPAEAEDYSDVPEQPEDIDPERDAFEAEHYVEPKMGEWIINTLPGPHH